jgi:uncharacterized protein (DUF58 family)
MTLEELLAAVRRVEVRTNRLVNDTMVGAYLSRFKGRGMDFEELREYLPGDDVRDIDWNVTYRLGRPFVKRFREERELAVLLVVDISGSSSFGSQRRTKRELAAEVAATLAISATRSGDKVGLLLFARETELFLPPRKGRRHILRVLREVIQCAPRREGTNVPGALAFLNHVQRRRALVFLITDFLPGAKVEDSERGLVREVGLTNARHDLVCVHLHDPRESEMPASGLVTIEDAETGELLELDSTRAAVRRQFAATNAERLAELDRALRRAGVDTLRFRTDEPFAATLQHFFETRRGRRRG